MRDRNGGKGRGGGEDGRGVRQCHWVVCIIGENVSDVVYTTWNGYLSVNVGIHFSADANTTSYIRHNWAWVHTGVFMKS